MMEKREPVKKKSTLRRLLLANLLALAVFLAVSLSVLWALGLLPSIFTFIF